VSLTPEGSAAANYAFDVTQARLVGGLIAERGRCPASAEGLLGLYPERPLDRIWGNGCHRPDPPVSYGRE
jgi:hypothetical protein